MCQYHQRMLKLVIKCQEKQDIYVASMNHFVRYSVITKGKKTNSNFTWRELSDTILSKFKFNNHQKQDKNQYGVALDMMN